MDDERIPRDFDKQLRGMKIVIAALVMGVIVFGVITLVVSDDAAPDRQPVLAFMGLTFAAIAFLIRAIVSRVSVTSARKRLAAGTWKPPLPPQQGNYSFPTDATLEEKFAFIYQSRLIVRAAILEGASFFNLIAFMTDHQWWSFAIAAVFAAVNLSTIPSRDGLLSWIDQQIELLNLETQSNQ